MSCPQVPHTFRNNKQKTDRLKNETGATNLLVVTLPAKFKADFEKADLKE